MPLSSRAPTPFITAWRDNGGYYLTPEQVTLAEVLDEAGYATGAFVGAFVLDSRWGLDQGFRHYFDDFELEEVADKPLNAVYRRGDEVVDEALQWMTTVKDGPFFSWIHLYDPHRPYDAPPGFPRGYDGEVAFVDSLIGELVAWLDGKRAPGIDVTRLRRRSW